MTPADHDPPVGPFGAAMMIACLAFLLAGLAMPEAAEALLRMLLVTLAVGFVIARAYAAMLPATTTQDFYSPFEDHAAGRTAPTAPQGLRRLACELRPANAARTGRRTPVPWDIRWTLIEEASRRLAEHHGLSVAEACHRPKIRALVSDPTWSLIRSGDPASASGTPSPAGGGAVPLSQLALILDDLERL